MVFDSTENIYNESLNLKIKEQTGPKKLKKILKNLRNIAKEELKGFSELKIKISEEEKKEEIKSEFKIVAPIIGFQHYFEDFKKINLKSNINNADYEGENTPSTVEGDEEELKQIDSSDFSEDD